MKKLFYTLSLVAFAGLVFLGSCKKKDEDPSGSSIQFSKSNPAPGDTFSVRAEILVSNIRKVKLSYRIGTGSEVSYDSISFTSNQSNLKVNFKNVKLLQAKTYTIIVTAYNNNNNVLATITQEISIVPTVRTASSIKLGDQSNPSDPSYLTLSPAGIVTVSSANVTSTNVDLNFVSLPTPPTASSKATFISPDLRASKGFTSNTHITNVTFIGTTTLPYDATPTQIWDAAVPTTKEVEIEVNKVYIFKTTAGYKGLIKVSALGGTAGSNNRTVTFDVKILEQKP